MRSPDSQRSARAPERKPGKSRLRRPARLRRQARGRSLAAALFTLAYVLLGASGTRAGEEDDLSGLLPRIPPRTPEEALAAFHLEPGFEIELVASEPDVIDPVDLAFDEEGRLVVAEMRDYPFTLEPDNLTTSEEAKNQPPGRVRLLEDTDGDGRADRSAVFLDGLHWPTAVACAERGVLVIAAPDIVFARDRDGDGAADERRVLYTGFGRRNVQALANGLVWGPDLRLYGLSGGNGGTIRRPGDPSFAPLRLGRRDFRLTPAGIFEAVAASGGQFGVAFDAYGRRFVSSNSDHLRFVVLPGRHLERHPLLAARAAAESIAEDGPAAPVFRTSPPEPWRVIRTRWRAASPDARKRYPPTELVPQGFFTSATGLAVYTADLFPPLYRGNVFVGDVGGNLVHRKALSPRGASFRGRRPPGSERREFLTSDDNWFRPVRLAVGPEGALYICDMYRETIEHPYSIPDRLRRRLRLTSGNDRGRIWRIVPAGRKPSPPLKLARAGAAALASALRSGNAWVRRTASRLLVERKSEEAVPLLRRILRESEGPPQLDALWTLERLGGAKADDLRAALGASDPGVREGALFLLAERPRIEAALAPALLERRGDPAGRVRLALALAARGIEGGGALRILADLALRDAPDPWIRTAVLASACGRESELLEALLSGPEDKVPPSRFLADLSELAGAEETPGEAQAAAAAALRSWPERPLAVVAVLSGLARGLERRGRSLLETLRSAPGGEATAERYEAVLEEALEAAADRRARLDLRRAAVELSAFAGAERSVPVLRGILGVNEPPALQLEALRALGRLSGREATRALLESWPKLSPELRFEAEEAVFRRRDRLGFLLDALESGALPRAALSLTRRRQLLDHPDPSIRRRAEALFAEAERARPEAEAVRRKALALTGDPRRGEDVYRKTCSSCHRARGAGHEVGPDLESVANRTPEELLAHILEPNRLVDPRYAAYTALTRDGRAYSGIVTAENESAVTLRRAGGVEDTLLRSELLSLEATGLSLMPEGLEETLSPQDLADVVAFVRGLSHPAEGK